MGIGLLSAIKLVPWGEVIAASPALVAGAKKLWRSAKEQSAEPPGNTRSGGVEARVHALEAKVAELARENAESAEIVKSLAEQNAQLVAAVENLRVRSRVLLVTSAVVVVVLVIVLVRLVA